MLKIEKKVVYKAFGLSITSEIPLLELTHVDSEVDFIDIEIKYEDLILKWQELSIKNTGFIEHENEILYKFSNIAIFAVREGSLISVSPLQDYDEDVARLVILGTCMGVILMQRKILPLHGSAVAINGKAFAIIGDSGAGKSTLASAFVNRGFKLLTDDVIAVSLNDYNLPFVTPSYPQQKLWIESLKEFGLESSHYQPIYQRETKFAVPVSAHFGYLPLPLAGIFELVKDDCENVEILPIHKLSRLHTLLCHTYRNFLIPRLGLMDWHFSNSTSIVSQIDMFKLRRPTSRFTANDLVSLILNTIHKEDH